MFTRFETSTKYSLLYAILIYCCDPVWRGRSNFSARELTTSQKIAVTSAPNCNNTILELSQHCFFSEGSIPWRLRRYASLTRETYAGSINEVRGQFFPNNHSPQPKGALDSTSVLRLWGRGGTSSVLPRHMASKHSKSLSFDWRKIHQEVQVEGFQGLKVIAFSFVATRMSSNHVLSWWRPTSWADRPQRPASTYWR